MKKALLILAAVAFASCSSNDKSSNKSDSTATKPATSDSTKATQADASVSWIYKTDTDKMTSKQGYYAQISATNKLNFAFPYEGGSFGAVTVRKTDSENEVLLTIDKGQFLGGENHPVNVKFDNDAPLVFESSEPSDGSSTVLFLGHASKFIKRLKTAKKMIVQAEFYQSGSKEMEFDVAGLKWEH